MEMKNEENKDEYNKIISDSITHIHVYNWKSHIVRAVNQDQFRLDTIEQLQEDQCLFIIMDWAMKFLPMKYRETQSDWFGQRGRNWHVIVCIYKGIDGSVNYRTYTHVFDAVKQDWFCVASILEHTLTTIKEQLPQTKRISLRSYNAGCYNCGHLWLSIPEISKRTGIHIQEYCYSEAQAGKSYCDSKIAHMRTKMKSWVTSGKNILTSSDMKTALDHGKGVAGCQVAECTVDTSKQSLTTHKIKNVSDFSHVSFKETGITLKKAYNIGHGKFISYDDLDKLSSGKFVISGCIVISNFDMPPIVTGKIIPKKASATIQEDREEITVVTIHTVQVSDTLFHCTVLGCTKMFATYAGFQNHILIGKHTIKLERETTYDKIRHQWVQICNEVVFKCKNTCITTHSGDNNINDSRMGWALRRPRKVTRFHEKIRAYLVRKFQEGKTSGHKCNPADVAKDMKRARDSNGQKCFTTDQWLSVAQITSYFSRLSKFDVKTEKENSKSEYDDDDLIAALAAIEEEDIVNKIHSA